MNSNSTIADAAGHSSYPLQTAATSGLPDPSGSFTTILPKWDSQTNQFSSDSLQLRGVTTVVTDLFKTIESQDPALARELSQAVGENLKEVTRSFSEQQQHHLQLAGVLSPQEFEAKRSKILRIKLAAAQAYISIGENIERKIENDRALLTIANGSPLSPLDDTTICEYWKKCVAKNPDEHFRQGDPIVGQLYMTLMKFHETALPKFQDIVLYEDTFTKCAETLKHGLTESASTLIKELTQERDQAQSEQARLAINYKILKCSLLMPSMIREFLNLSLKPTIERKRRLEQSILEESIKYPIGVLAQKPLTREAAAEKVLADEKDIVVDSELYDELIQHELELNKMKRESCEKYLLGCQEQLKDGSYELRAMMKILEEQTVNDRLIVEVLHCYGIDLSSPSPVLPFSEDMCLDPDACDIQSHFMKKMGDQDQKIYNLLKTSPQVVEIDNQQDALKNP